MTPLPVSPQVFAILRLFVEERIGLHYGTSDGDLLADKIMARATEAQFESLLDYYYFLRYDPAGVAELDALIDALVVNETYLFREADALRAVVDHVIAPRVAKDERPRIWCAACASGEEAYTLAMILDERRLLSRVEIVATDISLRALSRAREGVYGGRALRSLPEGVVGRWVSSSGATVTVREDLRRAITWQRVNLVDPFAVRALGAFDLILCRNVLIYFSDVTAERVVAQLTDALRPGGSLLVGVAESLLRFGTRLSCEEHDGVFLYRKGE